MISGTAIGSCWFQNVQNRSKNKSLQPILLMIRQIKETCLYAADLEKTEHFYKEILGLDMIGKKPGKHVFFRVGNDVLLLFNPDDSKQKTELPGHYARGKQHIAFEVSNVDYEKTKQELIDKGVEITHEEHWRDNILSFYFEDPDGHVLEIMNEGLWDY